MKNVLHAFAGAAVLAGAALAACLGSGCESADSYSISVSPNYARLKHGQSVALNASGWENFQWSLDNESGAHLSGTTGKSVVFYAEGASGTNAATGVYNVTVTAVGSGSSSGSGTNSVSSAGYTAKAKIVVE